MLKKRIEIVFKTDGSKQQADAISKVTTLIEGLMISVNDEAKRAGWTLAMKMKEN